MVATDVGGGVAGWLTTGMGGNECLGGNCSIVRLCPDRGRDPAFYYGPYGHLCVMMTQVD